MPVPGIAADIFEATFGFPAENPVCLFGIGPAVLNVAGTPRAYFIGQLAAAGS